MSALTLRPALPGDAEALAQIMRTARETMAYLPQDLHSMDDDRKFVRDVLLEQQEVTVAWHEGVIIGFAALEGDLLTQLYVAPARFGQGAGTRLLREAMSKRPKGLDLWVFEPNQGAIRLYERHGFKTVKKTDGGGNEELVPDRLMAWRPATST